MYLYNIMDVDKEILVNTIKDWIQVDNDIKEIQKAAKDFREKKKQLTLQLVEVMRENQIDNFDVKDGTLMYKCSKVKGPVNKKHLISTLSQFFRDDKKQAEDLCNYILDTRPIKTKETIQRKIYK
jgi:hypothetical protein